LGWASIWRRCTFTEGTINTFFSNTDWSWLHLPTYVWSNR
jgi:hypothetical protein